MPEIRTVRGPHTVEIDKIDGSRFIADVGPAADQDAAQAFVETVRAREPDATHHCWAMRTADGVGRSSDDGEPRDTAGPPILRRLEAAGITNVAVVVTRYYGGTKLGRGGLIRAYGSAASAVLDAVEVDVRPQVERVSFEHPYDLSAEVASVMAAHDARVVDSHYGASVGIDAEVPVDEVEAFARAMRDATAGAVPISRSGATSG